jgi:hypothetical protein
MKERHSREAEKTRLVKLNGEVAFSKSEPRKVRYGNPLSESEISFWLRTIDRILAKASGFDPQARGDYFKVCEASIPPPLLSRFRFARNKFYTCRYLSRDQGPAYFSRSEENDLRYRTASGGIDYHAIQQAGEQDQQRKQNNLFHVGGC